MSEMQPFTDPITSEVIGQFTDLPITDSTGRVVGTARVIIPNDGWDSKDVRILGTITDPSSIDLDLGVSSYSISVSPIRETP